VERFDRIADRRLHQHTLAGLLHADHTLPGLDYDHLLRVARALTRDQREVLEAWRRACFNVLTGTTTARSSTS
jgi:serine/threonine-protein kinase HipA